jgi:AcrR family transcriptional regulator
MRPEMTDVKSLERQATAAVSGTPEPQTDRRTAILYAAAHVFIDKGYRASSLEDVAEQFGFKRQAIYHYFHSKEQLLYEILSFSMDVHEATVATVLASTADPEERLLRLVRSQVMDITTREADGEFSLLLDGELHELTPEHREEITRRRRESLDIHRELLSELMRRGRVRELNPSIAALSLQSMVTAVARWYRRDGPLSAEEVADEITRIALGILLLEGAGGADTSR